MRRDIPILLATGYIEESVREQANLLGFHEILVNPCRLRFLPKQSDASS